MADTLDSEIARAARAIAEGAPVPALARLAALLDAHPADPRAYFEAGRALFAAVEQPAGLAALDPRLLERLCRRLVLQADCATRPLIFHHEVASRLTSQGAASVPALVPALEPTLRAMLDEGAPPMALLLFLLLARASLGSWLPRARLTALHRAAFPDFTERDMSLPYSTMFHGGAFARNRDDLIDALAADAPAFLAPLRPRHLPMLAWLRGGRSPFPAGAFGPWLAAAVRAPLDETDAQAARALVLAYGVPREPDEATRAALGLDATTLEEAERLAAARASLPRAHAPGDAAAERLERRGWQALAAARAIAVRGAPFLARGQRRVKVAVWVSGQLRGFRQVLPSWRGTIFAHADVRYFVHAWAAIGRGPAQPWRAALPFSGERFLEAYRRLCTQEGLETFEARYPTLYAALHSSATVTADDLRALYGTAHAIVDDERAAPFAAFSNARKMHYKLWAAHRLARDSGEEFDLAVRIRPDLDMRLAAFDWRDLRAACAGGPRLYADSAFGVHHGVPMIGDQLAIGAPSTMARYAATWEEYPAIAARDIAGAPRDFLGHVSLAQTCWLNGIAVRRAPVKLGGLREPEAFGSAAILAALEADAAGRTDAIDRALIHAARADLAR